MLREKNWQARSGVHRRRFNQSIQPSSVEGDWHVSVWLACRRQKSTMKQRNRRYSKDVTGTHTEWAFLCGSEFTLGGGNPANVRQPFEGMSERKSRCG